MRTILLAIPLALSACTDAQLSSASERYRAYVCTHTIAVSDAANYTIDNAEKLFSNPGIRNAAVARARADLEIVGSCGK